MIGASRLLSFVGVVVLDVGSLGWALDGYWYVILVGSMVIALVVGFLGIGLSVYWYVGWYVVSCWLLLVVYTIPNHI